MGIKPDKDAMRAAIQMAELNKTPFGAVLAMGDQVFATAVSKREEMEDLSSHPPMKVIRQLSEQTGKKDLSGYELYSTCEPCQDCMEEIHHHNLKTVIYGCGMSELNKYSYEHNAINESDVAKQRNDVQKILDFMKEECEALLRNYL